MSNEEHLDLKNVSYLYSEDEPEALTNIDLSIEEGEFVAVLGHNGCGKSTLAKLLNALYLPTSGRVIVLGFDTNTLDKPWLLRKNVGMVFQNPDNQIVATSVREDVAFGLENIGIPSSEMPSKISKALKDVNMEDFADRPPHVLSGGQKQRVAIAGILAMNPKILILDESTAMLDPAGKKEVFDTVSILNKEKGITVVWITHFMDEAAKANRVIVMNEGKIVMNDTPKAVFSDIEKIRSLKMDVPHMTLLSHMLNEKGIALPKDILTVEEMVEELNKYINAN